MARTITQNKDNTQAQQIVHQVLNGIVETLVKKGRINLREFGVFEVRNCEPQLARNPRTGERVVMPGRAVVTFKPGQEMEEKICYSHRHAQALSS
jgi:nucleoid DNA-binding protein